MAIAAQAPMIASPCYVPGSDEAVAFPAARPRTPARFRETGAFVQAPLQTRPLCRLWLAPVFLGPRPHRPPLCIEKANNTGTQRDMADGARRRNHQSHLVWTTVLDLRRPLSTLAVFLFAASTHVVEREMHGCPKCRQQCGLVDLETWRVIDCRE